jgi:ribokinase
MTGPVLVVGDLMVDVVATHDGPLAHGSDTEARVTSGGGGSAANTAAWLARAGTGVRLVAAVGDDALGRAALDELATAGVSFAGPIVADRPTGTCVVLVDPTGERTMLPDRGANDALSARAVLDALEPRPVWLHLSGYTLLGDGSRPAGLAAVDAARSAGVRWSVDASSAAPLEAVGLGTFLGWVRGADVLFANDDEIAALGGIGELLTAVTAVVAKHGPDGASWHAAAGTWSAPATATPVVDTVGAGDALDAGVIAAVVSGDGPEDSLRAGTALATRAVIARGGRPAPADQGS